MNIKNAAILSSISGLFSNIIGLLNVVLVARLLTPEEIGVFVIASSLTLIASELRTIGINTYIIREASLTKQKVSRCIGLAILFSYGFALFLIAASSPLAAFYGNNNIQYLLVILCAGFFVVPFTAATSATLSRDYRFRRVLLIQNIGPLIGLITTIGLIKAGLSYFSLAIGQSVTAVTTVIIARVVRPSWMSWKPLFFGLGDVLKVGTLSSGIQVMQKFQTIIPDLVFGRVAGPAFTAVFSRAMGLQVFVYGTLLTSVNNIALPYFSSESRQQNDVGTAYIKASNIVNCFVVPPLVCASILSESLIYVMFGEQWGESVFYARLLGIWMVLRALHYTAFPLLLSLKRERPLFISRLFSFSLFVFGVVGVSAHEPEQVVYVFLLVGLVDFAVLSRLIKRNVGVGLADYLRSNIKSFVVTTACAAVAYLISSTTSDGVSHTAAILLSTAILPVVWAGTIFYTRHIIGEVAIGLYRKISNRR
ncbi:MAG: oligosaccharide flippase family protein [Pseudohaliea sp.]